MFNDKQCRSRTDSIKSIRSFYNLRRIARTTRNNADLWNNAMAAVAPRSGRRTPVIIINQVEKTSNLATLFHHKCFCAGAGVYAILCLILVICCTIHSFDRLTHFLFYPTTIDVKFYENVTITPPCITICGSDMRYNKNPVIWQPFLKEAVGEVTYDDAYDLMKKTNLSIENLWNMSRLTIKGLDFSVIRGNLWSRYQHHYTITEKDTFTVNGICSTFVPKEQIPCVGTLSGIRLKSDEEILATNEKFISYTAIFHSEEEIPEVRYYGTLGSGVHLPYKEFVITALRLRQISNLDSWNDPCDARDVVAKCVARCIENNIILMSNLTSPCRLPYMEEFVNIPPCRTAEQFLDIYTSTEKVLTSVDIESDCGCHKSCKSTVYTSEYFFKEPTEHKFDVFINFPDCEIEIVEEVKNYGITAFLSDIGGALGLFLGISMLSLHEFAKKLIKRKQEGKPLFC